MRAVRNCVLVLLLLASATLPGEITYEGQPPVRRSSLEQYVQKLAGRRIDGRSLADSATAWLCNAGYLDGRALAENEALVVTAGDQYQLERLYVDADSAFQIEVGAPFTRDALDEALDDILAPLRRQGRYFAELTVRRVDENNHRLFIEVALRPGPVTVITGNKYGGLKRTRREIVDRYMPASSGDTLTDELLRQTEQAAAGIEFLEFLPPVVVRPLAGYAECDLDLNFREKKQVQIQGGGGYIPNDPVGLAWNADLRLTNLFGGGRDVGVRSERRERGRTVFDVGYQQPLFLIGIDRVGLRVATRDYRDRFYEFRLEVDYSSRIGRSLIAGMELGWKRVEPAAQTPGYSRFTGTYSIQRTELDNRRNPARGSELFWEIAFAYRRYSDDSMGVRPEGLSFNETRTSVAMAFYNRLFGSLVGHLSLGYVGLETSESLPPEAEIYFIGGPGTLRGHRNDQFLAQRAATGTLEPRLRFDQGCLFAFYDAAYLNRPIQDAMGQIQTDELYRFGYGFGFTLADSEKSLTLALGWNPQLAFDQPRVSIEFSTGF